MNIAALIANVEEHLRDSWRPAHPVLTVHVHDGREQWVARLVRSWFDDEGVLRRRYIEKAGDSPDDAMAQAVAEMKEIVGEPTEEVAAGG